MHNNYILVVGEQEETDKSVAVRNYKTKGQTVEKTEEFIARIVEEVTTKIL
jgi:threonyl-tRNA synthetase